MNTGERYRKRRESAESREVPESVPPPRRRRERSELDPDRLWDSGSEETGSDDDLDEDLDGEGDLDDIEEGSLEVFDDWDSPLRGLKIN
jgi:hypothetical protein